MSQFDTFLIGRKTFDAMKRMGNAGKSSKGITNIVFSRTLKPSDYPKVRIEADAERVVKELKDTAGEGHRHLRRRRAVSQPAHRRPGRSPGDVGDPGAARSGIPSCRLLPDASR